MNKYAKINSTRLTMSFFCQISKHLSHHIIKKDIYSESTTFDEVLYIPVEIVCRAPVESSFPPSLDLISGCRFAAVESSFMSARAER